MPVIDLVFFFYLNKTFIVPLDEVPYVHGLQPDLPSTLMCAEGKRDADIFEEATDDFSPPEFS